MSRAKKKKSPARKAAQYARSLKNQNGKYRGKIAYVKVKSGTKPKKINDKMQSKIIYKKKAETK